MTSSLDKMLSPFRECSLNKSEPLVYKKEMAGGVLHMDKDRAKKNLSDFADIMDAHGVRYFLIYGTLLGAVRDHDFIQYDWDTDLGMYLDDIPQLVKALPELLNKGFSVLRVEEHNHYVSFIRDNEYIDLDFFLSMPNKGKKCWYCLEGIKFYGAHLDELSTVEFLGRNFTIPNDPEGLLRQLYGRNWRTPKRGSLASSADLRGAIKRKLYFLYPLRSFIKKHLRI